MQIAGHVAKTTIVNLHASPPKWMKLLRYKTRFELPELLRKKIYGDGTQEQVSGEMAKIIAVKPQGVYTSNGINHRPLFNIWKSSFPQAPVYLSYTLDF